MKKFTLFPSDAQLNTGLLNVKFGIDPTSDRLHLGHLIPLLMVRNLIDEGHNITIVLGTFTAQLGDPSGKDTMRPILTKEDTVKNGVSIARQIRRILKGDCTIHENHTWFEEMSAIQMTNILSKFTTTQLLSRDSFQKRIFENNPICLHELVVPILQGFDSVHLETDLEIGGTDQLFNFSITRDVQRIFDQKPEVCFLMPIINGIDGRKMSKSFGNCIFIDDTREDVFGKVMSISDTLMVEWWPLFFDRNLDIAQPMLEKKNLAYIITKEIWSINDANKALENFESVIQNRNTPSNMFEVSSSNIIKNIVEIRKCSLSEAKRLIKQNAVKLNDQTVTSENVNTNIGDIIKIGKLNFAKVIT